MKPILTAMLLSALAAVSSSAPAGESVGPLDGTVLAFRSSYVNAETIGIVAEILVEEGQRVETGQELAQLSAEVERANYELALLQSRDDTALRITEANLKQAEKELERDEHLFKEGTIQEAAYEKTRYARDKASLEVESRKMELKRLAALADLRKATLDQSSLRAPFSGIVAEKLIELGETTYPLDKRLFHIIDVSKVYVDVHPEIALAKDISVGMSATVTTQHYAEKRFAATVTFVSPAVDAGGRWLGIKVLVDNGEGLLRPGMKASVSVELPSEDPGEGASSEGIEAASRQARGAPSPSRGAQ
jgi:RND family efflux transporter MFP subunit